MAATAVDLAWQKRGKTDSISLPVVDADIIYDGTMVTADTNGEAFPASDLAGHVFMGLAKRQVDNTDDGESVEIDARPGLTFWANAGTGFTPNQADIGLDAYVADDNTVVSAANSTAKVYVGTVIGFSGTRVLIASEPFQRAAAAASALTAWTQTYSTADRTVANPTGAAPDAATSVAITDSGGGSDVAAFAAGVGSYWLTFPIALAGITTAADVVTDLVIGHKFKILSAAWVTTTVASTGAKNATLTVEIGATPVTSLSFVLDSDLAITTTRGLVTQVDATGANTGSASDTVSVIAGTVAAFSEGSGAFMIEIQNMDVADAFKAITVEHAALLVDIASARTQVTALVADDLDNRRSITALIDDLQALGLAL